MGKDYDDDDYRFYDNKALIRDGIFTDENELYRARKNKGFPDPIKTGSTFQAKARYRVSEVHRWLDSLVGNPINQTYRKDDPNPPRRRAGRPGKAPIHERAE